MQDRDSLITYLRSRYGVDVRDGDVTGLEPDSRLCGLLGRVEVRARRRLLGLPTAGLLKPGTCCGCSGPRRRGDQWVRLEWRQEEVEAHRECVPGLARSSRVEPVRGGAAFVLDSVMSGVGSGD